MSNTRNSRFVSNYPHIEQHTFLLPSPSEDSLPSLLETDSDIDPDNPSEISFQPAHKRYSPLLNDGKEGGGSKKRPRSVQPSLSKNSLSESEEPSPTSRKDTVEEDLKRKKKKKKGFIFECVKAKNIQGVDKGSKKIMEDADDKEKKERREKKKKKKPFSQTLRQKLSLKPHRDRDEDRRKIRSKHGFAVSSDHINLSNEPIEADSRGRVRTSQHMTAEVKLHFWRDKYEGEGRLGAFLKLLRRKRVRKLLKTAIDLQAASLGSLRTHPRRRHDER